MDNPILQNILTSPVYDVARETELQHAPKLSARCGQEVWLKREDLQPVFSFKIRGAYQKIHQLSESGIQKELVTSSAGNHAQGVALAARKCGIPAVIFMPKTTPLIKVSAVEGYGARVQLIGDTYDEAYQAAKQYEEDHDCVFIHPYDDLDVIAGQGTIGMELIRECNKLLKAVFIPVGGGGLLAGIGLYIKSVNPSVRIIGVEPDDAASMKAAFDAGKPVPLDHVGLFADGVAVREVGQHTFDLCKDYVDELIQVSTDEICAAIKDVFEDTRSILEPAGALSVAGVKKWSEGKESLQGRCVALACGANMNFDRLRHVSERAEIGEGKEVLFSVTIPEQPGTMLQLCERVGGHNITEFNYRIRPGFDAHVFLGIELYDPEDKSAVIQRLQRKPFTVTDLSENEMAKLHLRHLVGGRASSDTPEMIYRFQFPERPGALYAMLAGMPSHWNISLFHYRNHGAAFGRVLTGLQIPHEEKNVFESFITDLGYEWTDETENPAVMQFLRA